jgi:hypothetical protein
MGKNKDTHGHSCTEGEKIEEGEKNTDRNGKRKTQNPTETQPDRHTYLCEFMTQKKRRVGRYIDDSTIVHARHTSGRASHLMFAKVALSPSSPH